MTETPKPVLVTAAVTETAEPSASPAPGVDTGVSVDPTTGAVRMGKKSGTALGVAVWLVSVVAGLATAYVVMP